MTMTKQFGEVLDAVEELDYEEQKELVEVLKRRIDERWRARLLADIEEGRREFASGKLRTQAPAEIIAECYE